MKVFGASPSSTQMYFLSTVVSAYYEYTIAYNDTGIILWTLNGTDTLSSANPQLSLGAVQMYAGPYSSPPLATQKEGFRPLAYLLGAAGLPGRLDSSDTRALSLVYAAGSLWGTFATGTYVNNRTLTGAAVVQVSGLVQEEMMILNFSVTNVASWAEGLACVHMPEQPSCRGIMARHLPGKGLQQKQQSTSAFC